MKKQATGNLAYKELTPMSVKREDRPVHRGPRPIKWYKLSHWNWNQSSGQPRRGAVGPAENDHVQACCQTPCRKTPPCRPLLNGWPS